MLAGREQIGRHFVVVGIQGYVLPSILVGDGSIGRTARDEAGISKIQACHLSLGGLLVGADTAHIAQHHDVVAVQLAGKFERGGSVLLVLRYKTGQSSRLSDIDIEIIGETHGSIIIDHQTSHAD